MPQKSKNPNPRAKEIVQVINGILDIKERILDEPDLDSTAVDLQVFGELVSKFERLDKRSNETQEQQDSRSHLRDSEKNKMIYTLIDEMRAKIEAYEIELSAAARIHNDLIPRNFPDCDGYEMEAYYCPSRKISGDFYDYFIFADGYLYILICDIVATGIPSTALAHSCSGYLSAQIHERIELETIIHNLNLFLMDKHYSEKVLSLFITKIHLETGELKYVNAGHPPPYVISPDGSEQTLETGDTMLGLNEESTFSVEKHVLEKGELLALYTHGVTDLSNGVDDVFTLERLLDTIKSNLFTNVVNSMIQIFKNLRLFANDHPFDDDVTLFLLKRKQ